MNRMLTWEPISEGSDRAEALAKQLSEGRHATIMPSAECKVKPTALVILSFQHHDFATRDCRRPVLWSHMQPRGSCDDRQRNHEGMLEVAMRQVQFLPERKQCLERFNG